MRTVPDPSSVGGRGMDFITTVASVGLALVLLCSIGFALYASATTSSADQRLTVALRLSILYTNARFQAGAEESQERQYLLDPGPTAAAAHASAARALATILRAVVARAPTANAAEARRLVGTAPTLPWRYAPHVCSDRCARSRARPHDRPSRDRSGLRADPEPDQSSSSRAARLRPSRARRARNHPGVHRARRDRAERSRSRLPARLSLRHLRVPAAFGRRACGRAAADGRLDAPRFAHADREPPRFQG